jgi:hypothetical protein
MVGEFGEFIRRGLRTRAIKRLSDCAPTVRIGGREPPDHLLKGIDEQVHKA